jgi:hypothetical protein
VDVIIHSALTLFLAENRGWETPPTKNQPPVSSLHTSFQLQYPKAPFSPQAPDVSPREEGVAEDNEGRVPVDVKENGIGDLM